MGRSITCDRCGKSQRLKPGEPPVPALVRPFSFAPDRGVPGAHIDGDHIVVVDLCDGCAEDVRRFMTTSLPAAAPARG